MQPALRRKTRGWTTVPIVIVLSIFVIFPLGLLGLEIGRYVVMQQQLQNVTDAAALCGTAALASAPQGYTYTDLQILAMQVAAQNFQQNSVLRTLFSTTNVNATYPPGTPPSTPPAVGHANISFALYDSSGTAQPIGSLTAAVMQVTATYTDKTLFASNILPILPTETATVKSNGGLPMLDLILCFDVSGSMDDSTEIALVERYWSGANRQNVYNVISAAEYTDASGLKGPTIYDVAQPADTGSSLNIQPPQNLTYNDYNVNGTPVYNYSESRKITPYSAAVTNPLFGLRSLTQSGSLVPEQGGPPGNYNSASPGTLIFHGLNPITTDNNSGVVWNKAEPNGTLIYTDMVPYSATTFTAPYTNIAYCVEASRGNLDNSGVMGTACPGSTVATNHLTAATGTYMSYWNWVRSIANPVAAANAAAKNFFYTMNASSNAHFGLVAFSDTVGTGTASTFATNPTYPSGLQGNENSDANYLGGGTSNVWGSQYTSGFPLPLIQLNQGQSNYTQVLAPVTANASFTPGTDTLTLGPCGGTNISAALNEAVAELTNNALYRPGARKAIVLFTDGIPDQPSNQATGISDAYAAAGNARTASIPIYAIGLSQNTQITPTEAQVLGDGTGSTPCGIPCKAAINPQGVYIPVSSSQALNSAFQKIARSLVVLQTQQ